MSVQLPPVGDPLEERLASLEDPAFAARLFNENPSLYAKTLAQIQKQARQRRLWTASLAGTAIVSLTAGLFMGPTISKLLSPPAAQKHTVAAAPMRSIPAREPARVEQRTSPVAPPARRGPSVLRSAGARRRGAGRQAGPCRRSRRRALIRGAKFDHDARRDHDAKREHDAERPVDDSLDRRSGDDAAELPRSAAPQWRDEGGPRRRVDRALPDGRWGRT